MFKIVLIPLYGLEAITFICVTYKLTTYSCLSHKIGFDSSFGIISILTLYCQVLVKSGLVPIKGPLLVRGYTQEQILLNNSIFFQTKVVN